MKKKANDGRFNIFDTQLIRFGDKVETTVHRKPSASDRYLHFTSEQAWHEKTAAIHTLTLRAQNHHSNILIDLLQQELGDMTHFCLDNGYPLPAIQWIIHMKTHSHEAYTIEQLDENSVDESKIDDTLSFYAPYHPHARKLFYNLKTFKKFNFTSVFKMKLIQLNNWMKTVLMNQR